MTNPPPLFIIITGLATFLIGISKGGLGGTSSALATPLMALVLPANQVIGLVLPLLMFADIFAVAFHWQRWNMRLVLLLLPGSVAGVTIGTLFITNAPTKALQTGLGVIILVFASYKIFEKRILKSLYYKNRSWHGLITGTITGFSSALAHTGGPPASIYLLMQDLSPRIFNATTAVFFFILNWIKVPYYIYAKLFNVNQILGIVWLMPLIPLGVWIGKWMSDRVPKQLFEYIIISLLVVTALMLIFR